MNIEKYTHKEPSRNLHTNRHSKQAQLDKVLIIIALIRPAAGAEATETVNTKME